MANTYIKLNFCLFSLQQQQQPLKLKSIRKDVFHYLKAVMEESRIFLPMKLPEEQEILPQPTPQMPEVVHVEVPEVIDTGCFLKLFSH